MGIFVLFLIMYIRNLITTFTSLLSFTTSAFSQKTYFTVTKHFENEDHTTDSIYFFAADTQQKLFSFCKKLEWGDCNSMAYEWGKYEVKNDSILLYSLFAYQGGANAQPFGVRKIIYTIQNKTTTLIEHSIFIEHQKTTQRDDWIGGVDYILVPPKTDFQKKQLAKYVAYVEKEYNGKLQLHYDAIKLIKEVRSKFNQLIKTKQKEWDRLAAPFNRYKI